MPSNILINVCTSIQGLIIIMFLHAYWSLGDNFDHLQYAYSERCDCISNETQFPPVVFWRLPFPRTGRGFKVFSVNKISGHIIMG